MRINKKLLEQLDGQLRDETQALLAKYHEIGENNPLVGYVPHPKQVVFHEGTERIKAFLGGNRSGKTTAGVLDDLIQACDRDTVPPHLQHFKKFEPPFHCRIVCPGEDVLHAVVHQKLREWCPKDQLVGGGFAKAYEKSRGILHFKNGSFFDFLTYGQDLDKFGGTAKHRIHYDEEPPEDIYKEGKMRLMDYPGADTLFTMTPQKGMDWMYDAIWEPWQKGTLKHGKVIVVDMDDNPHLSMLEKEIALEGYSREELQARKEGKFVHFHGMIYPDFSRHRHVIPDIEDIPKDAAVYVGIDPGHRHMCGVVWTYLTPDNELVVFEELALQGYTIPQTCEAIKLINIKWSKEVAGQKIPLAPTWYVIDPSAKNKHHADGRSDQMDYSKNGIVTISGQNDKNPGIDRIRWRLQEDKLHVAASCTTLIEEFRKYRWKSETRTEDDAKEEPIKRDDHLLDALRYVVMSEPYANRKHDPEEFMEPLKKAMREEIEGLRPNQIPSRAPEGGVFA